jgi:plastocyanin
MRWLSTMLALLALLALAACGAPPPERRVDLVVDAAGYAPPTLEARAGEQLFIRFVNDDTIAHSLTVDLPSGSRTVSAEDGVDAILALTLRDPGTFRMYCSVPGHTEEGQLVVLPGE